MALLGGYVETSANRSDGSQPSATSEWMMRNAFVLGLGLCVLFWVAVGAIVIVF